MLTIELFEDGIDLILVDNITCLQNALGKYVSKKEKDVAISKVLGSLEALRQMITIDDPVTNTIGTDDTQE